MKIDQRMNQERNNITNCPTVITGMSHEMRTHMNAIVAFSFLMKDTNCKTEEREDYSKQILSACDQLLELFDTFFDSAILDTGNTSGNTRSCRFDNILDELIPEFREIMGKDDRSELELITEIQFNNSKDVIIDRNRIFRVIRSLFNNSINNTSSGYIKIGYYLKDEVLTFYVLDSGQGYFKCKEFLQSEDINLSLAKYNDTYSAINITLAKKLIHLLGGSIRLECNGLTGSGFYFSLPARTMVSTEAEINKYINTMIAI